MKEVDAGRDRAMPASVRHDADEPLTLEVQGVARLTAGVAELLPLIVQLCPAAGRTSQHWSRGRSLGSVQSRVQSRAQLHPLSEQPSSHAACHNVQRFAKPPRMYLVRSSRS
jgi:hypothetical protein